MTDYTAKVRSKGLDATGVTEDIARQMHAHRGSYHMAIIELYVDRTSDDADGKHGVELTITQVEPAVDKAMDDHLRNLTRAAAGQRKLNSEDDQPTLDSTDDIEPKVSDVIAAGASQVLTCSNCLHRLDADGIAHEPEGSDSDGCTWADCGHLVHADDTRCTKRECEQQEAAPVPG